MENLVEVKRYSDNLWFFVHKQDCFMGSYEQIKRILNKKFRVTLKEFKKINKDNLPELKTFSITTGKSVRI